MCSLLVELFIDIFPLAHDFLGGKDLALLSLTFSPRPCDFARWDSLLAFWRLPTHLAVVLVCKSKLKHTFAVLSLTFPSFPSSPTYHHYWSLLWLCPMGSVWEKFQSFIWGWQIRSSWFMCFVCVCVCACSYIDEKRDTWWIRSYSCIFSFGQILIPRHLSISSKLGDKNIYIYHCSVA